MVREKLPTIRKVLPAEWEPLPSFPEHEYRWSEDVYNAYHGLPSDGWVMIRHRCGRTTEEPFTDGDFVTCETGFRELWEQMDWMVSRVQRYCTKYGCYGR